MDAASAGGTRASSQKPPTSASAWRKRKRCSVTAISVTPAACGPLAVRGQLVHRAAGSSLS